MPIVTLSNPEVRKILSSKKYFSSHSCVLYYNKGDVDKALISSRTSIDNIKGLNYKEINAFLQENQISRHFIQVTSSCKKYFSSSYSSRFAIVITRKVGKAHFRNLTKRRIRSVIQNLQHQITPGDYVIICRHDITNKSFLDIKRDLHYVFRHFLM